MCQINPPLKNPSSVVIISSHLSKVERNWIIRLLNNGMSIAILSFRYLALIYYFVKFFLHLLET